MHLIVFFFSFFLYSSHLNTSIFVLQVWGMSLAPPLVDQPGATDQDLIDSLPTDSVLSAAMVCSPFT